MSLYDRVLITGGGGMLAHAFRQSFTRRSIGYVALTREELDIADTIAVLDTTGKHQPTLIINCAAYTKVDQAEQEPELAERVNGRGPFVLGKARVPVVHFSTDFVFDGNARNPYPADHPTAPLSAYGRSKLSGERQLLKRYPESLVVRTAWLYGPQGACFPQTVINAAKAGKPLKVVNDQTGTPTFTYDLAKATLDLLDRNAKGIWHITNSGETTWFDFTRAILEEFNLKTELSPTTSAEWKKLKPNSAIRPAYSVLDVSPYEQLVGKPMPHWRDALHRYRLALEGV